jgi:hypothetical protein
MKTVSLKNITLSIFTLLMAATLLVSCGKSNDSKPSGGSGSSSSHKIIYKSTVTDGTIDIVDYTNAGGDQTTVTGLSVTSYTSPEITVPSSVGSVVFAVSGGGSSASSTITVQIYVDGVLKKTNTGSGTSLSAGTGYSF